MQASGVILAAGRGVRFGGRNKAFVDLLGRPIVQYSILAFVQSQAVDELVVVVQPGEEAAATALVQGLPLPVRIVPGGNRRQDSARAGVEAAQGKIVLIHDGARPLVSPELIQRVLAAAKIQGTAVPVLPVDDTVRYISQNVLLAETPARTGLVRIQTPQGFLRELILSAYMEAERRGLELPDDAAALLALGQPVTIVEGDPCNIKITRLGDLHLAARLLPQLVHWARNR